LVNKRTFFADVVAQVLRMYFFGFTMSRYKTADVCRLSRDLKIYSGAQILHLQ